MYCSIRMVERVTRARESQMTVAAKPNPPTENPTKHDPSQLVKVEVGVVIRGASWKETGKVCCYIIVADQVFRAESKENKTKERDCRRVEDICIRCLLLVEIAMIEPSSQKWL